KQKRSRNQRLTHTGISTGDKKCFFTHLSLTTKGFIIRCAKCKGMSAVDGESLYLPSIILIMLSGLHRKKLHNLRVTNHHNGMFHKPVLMRPLSAVRLNHSTGQGGYCERPAPLTLGSN